MLNNSLYGEFRGLKFVEVYTSEQNFITEVRNNPLSVLSVEDLRKLYYLLYAAYGNSTIANGDTNQFKYKLYSTIFMYGPTWAKRLEVQSVLRDLEEADLIAGSRAIYNHSLNPGTPPSTATLEELETIDSQNTTNYKRSKLEAYSTLLDLLATDVTKEFIDKFRYLFIVVAEPNAELLFTEEDMTWTMN